MSAKQTGAKAQRLLVAIVRTCTGVEADIGLSADVLGLHVQRGTEGTGAVGRGTCTALYLHALHRRDEVGHVDEVDLRALCVVDGHTVGSDVDTARVNATHADGGVADPVAGIGGRGDGGRQREDIRDILPEVHLFDLFLCERREGHRCLLVGAGGSHLYVLELIRADGVYRLVVGSPRSSGGTRQCDHYQ